MDNNYHTQEKVRLSVIIPCLNAADTISVQLEALANQKWSEAWEIIISNNGSTDETLTIVERFKGHIPHLRIVDSSDRRGPAYARNVGVLAASGDLLAFCDADDEVAPGWVAAMGEALSKYDFVAGRLETKKLNGSWVQKARSSFQQDGLQSYAYPPYLPHAAGCNLGMKRSLYDTIGKFDETFLSLHDTDYCWRAQLAGIELHFAPDAVIHHRFRNTLGGVYRQARRYGEYNVLLYKRYRPLGMPKLSWKASMKEWGYLLRSLLWIRSRQRLARWIWKFGWRIGRLQGSIKYRVFAL
jgi:glycosyltransferase involved in cell wall biosynthesis